MKRDVVSAPLLPFTATEEEALVAKLDAMGLPGLTHYVESAQLALANKALDASWRPRVELGLLRAEAALQRETLRAATAVPVVPEPAPTPKSKTKAKVEAEVEADPE
jgi:hypothetical protein